MWLKFDVYKKSFIHKVAMFSILTSVVVMSTLYYYTSLMMQQTLNTEYENYSKNFEAYLQDILLPLIVANDRKSINHILNSLMSLDIIESMKVQTFDDVIFERDKNRLVSSKELESKVFPLVTSFEILGMTVGQLKANLYLKERDLRFKDTLYALLFANAIAALLIIIAIILLLVSIKKKLSLFEAATRSITTNHIPEAIQIQGRDEFSQMALTFNSMLWQLREKYVAMDMSPDGILIVNNVERITYINTKLSQLLSLDSSLRAYLSLSGFNLILRRELNLAESTVDGLNKDFEEAVLVLNDKRHTTFRCHVKLYQHQDGEGYSKVYYFVDITHEKKIEHLKSEFLNTAAHELRTPLAGIYGYSELLINFDYKPEKSNQFLSIIHDQSKLLTSIIDDLLDLAKIESANEHFIDRRQANLVDTLDQACEQARIIARWKNIQIQCFYPDEIEAYFDSEKIRRALVNLLSNAVKYSDKDTLIEVHCNQGPSDEQIITIRDQGVGMSEEELDRLGEKFFRADKSGNIPGTGLGVSISNQIIQLHGGKLSYESSLGVGTIAVVTLPKRMITSLPISE